MGFVLNEKQAGALARFFLDIAKGLVLGGIGLAITTRLETKLVFVTLTLLAAFWIVKLALSLLEEAR
jgi:hypothetical protein